MKYEAKVRLYKGEGNLKGFAELTIGGAVVIKDLTIRSNQEDGSLFVSFPGKKGKDDKWYDTAHPITAEARKEISGVVLAAYKAAQG